MEQLVVEAFMDLAAGYEAEQADDPVDVEAIERRAAEAESLLDELSSLSVRRELGAQRWSALVQEAREDAEAARAEAATARARSQSVGIADRATLRQAWEGMTLPERQEALRSIIQAVMVVAGDEPVGERVHVIPAWVDVDLPRTGSTAFVVRPWVAGGD